MKNIVSGIVAEIRAVTWPTKIELLNFTLFTIVTCAIITLIILGLDVLFVELRETILNL